MGNYRVAVGEVHERSVGSVLAEIKDEVREFVQTRIDMLKSEMKDNVSAWKVALPMIGAALLYKAEA